MSAAADRRSHIVRVILGLGLAALVETAGVAVRSSGPLPQVAPAAAS